jgi:hypothetical protein
LPVDLLDDPTIPVGGNCPDPGRRFNRAPIFILQQIHFRTILFTHVMALELPLLKRMSLPIGVALFAAARKHGAGKRN